MDVTSAIPSLVGMVLTPDLQKAKIEYFTDSKGKKSAGVYSFQFNPSSLKLTQANKMTPGSGITQGKKGEVLGQRAFASGCALRFDVVIDHSEFRPSGFIEKAAYSLNSLNPLFIPVKSKNHVFKESDSSEKVADFVQIWYRWANAAPRDDKSGSDGDDAKGDLALAPLTFRYGELEFKGTITNLDVTLGLFDEDGNPRRAELGVSMMGGVSDWQEGG